MNYYLKLKVQTWNKDSNALFDYDSYDLTKSKQTIHASTVISKDTSRPNLAKNIINVFQNNNQSNPLNDPIIGQIDIDKDQFVWRYNNGVDIQDNKLYDDLDWLVVGKTDFNSTSTSSKKRLDLYQLKEGDIIRLGKFTMKPTGILINKNSKEDLIPQKKESATIFNLNKPKKAQNRICRICLNDEDKIDNPLINPCNCIGTVKYLHLDCVRLWILSKIIVRKTTYTTIYAYQELTCEICKANISDMIKYKGDLISLIDYHTATIPYITFQAINNENNELETIFLIEFNDKKKITIGRANDADFRLRDITISRFHSTLIYRKGVVYIEDLRSKFGTLILIQNTVMFLPEKPISFQKGKYHLIFHLKPKWCTKFCCNQKKEIKSLGYNDVIESQILHIYDNELRHIKVLQLDGSVSVSEREDSKQIKSDIKDRIELTNDNTILKHNTTDQSNKNISKINLHHNNSLVNFIKVIEKDKNANDNNNNKGKNKNNNCSFESGKCLITNFNNYERQNSHNNLLRADAPFDNQSYHFAINKTNVLSKINAISIHSNTIKDKKYSLSCKVNYMHNESNLKR